MEARLTPRGMTIVSNIVISLFALFTLVFFLTSIDRTAIVISIAVLMLGASLYLMWSKKEFDSVSLLIFFFGTTACFYFFSDIAVESWMRAASIAIFALLSLVLSNYLLNTVEAGDGLKKSIYKVVLAILFTEIFWVLSFLRASQISKGAITAVIFFNLESIVRDYLSGQFQKGKFAFLVIISIILLAIVIYRI